MCDGKVVSTDFLLFPNYVQEPSSSRSSWIQAALDPLGVFRGSVLGRDTSEPQPSSGEPREDMNNISCRRDMTDILLKAA